METLSLSLADPFAVDVVRRAFWTEPPASRSAFRFVATPLAGFADVVVVGLSPVMEARRSPICRSGTGQLVLGKLRQLGAFVEKQALTHRHTE